MTDDACGVPCGAPGGDSWFALRVRSNAEFTAHAGLGFAGLESFLPVYSSERRWSDRVKRVNRPLFPGYIFAPASAAVPELLAVSGVIGIVGGNLTPASLPGSEITAIRKILASMLPVSPVEYSAAFRPGDRVTVRFGALRGVSGVVVRHAKGVRLVVSVDMLGRALAVELDAAQLAKVAA